MIQPKILISKNLLGGLEDSPFLTQSRTTLRRSSRTIVENRHSNPQSNVTFVKATLGRKATIKCVAQNLVGQKTVSVVKSFDGVVQSKMAMINPKGL